MAMAHFPNPCVTVELSLFRSSEERKNYTNVGAILHSLRVKSRMVLSKDDDRRQRQRVSNVCGLRIRSAHTVRERGEIGGVALARKEGRRSACAEAVRVKANGSVRDGREN